MLIIPRISRPRTAEELPAALEKAGVAWTPIAQAPWANGYPYQPKAEVRVAHSGDALLVHFRVDEETVRAIADNNGNVWEDSCCEVFIRPTSSLDYYNIECNAAAHMLIGHQHITPVTKRESMRAEGDKPTEGKRESKRAEASVLATVQRWSSLGSELFEAKATEGPWELALIIPASALWCDQVTDLSGLKTKMNFYKCGDGLPRPHFLSWAPLTHLTPKFHLPQQFGDVEFEG